MPEDHLSPKMQEGLSVSFFFFVQTLMQHAGGDGEERGGGGVGGVWWVGWGAAEGGNRLKDLTQICLYIRLVHDGNVALGTKIM